VFALYLVVTYVPVFGVRFSIVQSKLSPNRGIFVQGSEVLTQLTFVPRLYPQGRYFLHVTYFPCINQIDMEEGGSDLGSDPDINETLSSCTEGPPSVADVLAMTVDELRTELRIRGASFVGGTKPELQAVLLQGLGHVGTPLQFQEDPTELEAVTEGLAPAIPKMPSSAAVPVTVPYGQAGPDYTLPPPAKAPEPSKEGSDPVGSVRALELQLQLRKLEIENRQFKAQQKKKQRQRHWEAQERDKSGSLSSGS